MNCFLRRTVVSLALIAFVRAIAAEQQISEDRDLKEIDLTGWNCANRPEGSGRSPETAERNRQKNRWTADVSGISIKPFDTAAFLKHFGDFDIETKSRRRKDLSPDEKRRLEVLEAPLVSLTGYLVLAYAGPPETTNCGSTDFHDWHLEILDEPLDHPPQPGDPTPIICEITPRTQNAIYRDGIRIQELAAFFRHPDVTYESTGHKAQKIRLTGYPVWDDEHNDSTKDVGVTIRSIARNRYHNPWRATAWEIHPVIKIQRADAAPSVPGPSPQVNVPLPSATPQNPNAAPQRFVTILRAVKIKIPYGETILQRGIRLPIISQ
ncbi:MAG TPA: hypothetical protein VE086_07530, partial [Chthoniobacterales bacterium]|nr:hypothetical protein [Chthoniobacterales bacterium]